MKKETRLIVFTVIISVVAIVLIVARYERLLKLARDEKQVAPVAGGAASEKNYTASEIIDLIKKDKQYIGDSITILDDGSMTSSNGKFQGTLNAVINVKGNMDGVKGEMKNNHLPIQYNIYHLAAIYYRGQYAAEFKSK